MDKNQGLALEAKALISKAKAKSAVYRTRPRTNITVDVEL